eukprot:487179_1
MNVLLLLVLFVDVFEIILGEKVRGTVNVGDSSGFSFLGKFCFQDRDTLNLTAGTIDVELTNNGDGSTKYYLALYDDQSNSWNKIYDSGLNCTEKISAYYRALEHVTVPSDSSFEKTIKIHQHLRPRWWWVYLVNCEYKTE